MALINKALCETMISACIDAEKDVLEGKTTTFQGRTITSENLSEIRAARVEWEKKLKSLTRGSRPAYKLARFC